MASGYASSATSTTCRRPIWRTRLGSAPPPSPNWSGTHPAHAVAGRWPGSPGRSVRTPHRPSCTCGWADRDPHATRIQDFLQQYSRHKTTLGRNVPHQTSRSISEPNSAAFISFDMAVSHWHNLKDDPVVPGKRGAQLPGTGALQDSSGDDNGGPAAHPSRSSRNTEGARIVAQDQSCRPGDPVHIHRQAPAVQRRRHRRDHEGRGTPACHLPQPWDPPRSRVTLPRTATAECLWAAPHWPPA